MKKHGTWQGAIAHKVELYYCDTAGYTTTCKHPCLPSGSEKTERRKRRMHLHGEMEEDVHSRGGGRGIKTAERGL